MKPISLSFAKYWRNNLADAALQGGNLDPAKLIRSRGESWKKGGLDPEVVGTLFNKVDKSGQKEADRVRSLDVLVYASVYGRGMQHGLARKDGIPGMLSTIMVRAKVDREGKLSAELNPYVPRMLLEPSADKKFFVGTMDEFDAFLARKSWPKNPDWHELIQRCKELEDSICDRSFLESKQFTKHDEIYLAVIDAKSMEANAGMIGLYDDMVSGDELDLPLFDTFANHNASGSLAVPSSISTIPLRTGHMEPAYPLADAQRDSLSVVMTADVGGIVAVNGPPGTGKTTLVQSVVASMWVTSAMKGESYPPVIVAASANNQAITNVIDSFGKIDEKTEDPLAGRWLPDLIGYGCYYPSSAKLAEASKRGYQTGDFMEGLETLEYVARAEKAYLETAAEVFEKVSMSIDDVVDCLKERIGEHHEVLESVKDCWDRLQGALEESRPTLGDNPGEAVERLKAELDVVSDHNKSLASISRRLNSHLASESFWILFFAFLPSLAKKRVARAIEALDLDPAEWVVRNIEGLQSLLDARLAGARSAMVQKASELERVMQLYALCEGLSAEWRGALKKFGLSADSTIMDFDRVADTAVRQPMFKLATHYWEGRWLMEMKCTLLAGDADNMGIRKMERKWRRRSMLAPCTVSTLFRLPKLFKAWQGEDKYLYNFIDLLIIDEAGQVLPSIGGQSFALAKRALVVGDTLQIAPVMNCDRRSDAGNLTEAGITTSYEETEKTGRAVFNGNAMRVAQTACDYHYDRNLERGMYLYEHRRCVDDIIQVCNDLCYQGKLIPRRGNKQRGMHGLPRMGYGHVPGESEIRSSNASASRYNVMETQAVIAFITDNAATLLQAYAGKTLDKVIAVVTPFASQAERISGGLERAGHRGIVVGTVHRMQGAEYPVVIFSPTYSRHDSSMRMLDETPNMLNVAVSRAQDSFIVIGDMNIFHEHSGKPSGVLARNLFADDGNRIDISVVMPAMNKRDSEIVPISTQRGHDDFLREALSIARQEVIIVSPWISEGVLRFTGLSDRIAEAVKRKVAVKIYTDRNNNRKDKLDEIKDSALEAMRMLSEAGAEVKFVRRIHNKDVFVDDSVMCRGSFNWLSVRRANDHDEEQIDASFRMAGSLVKDEKSCMVGILESRAVNSRIRAG